MKKEIATALLNIGAVYLSPDKPFTWASGIQSPIYCDNRLTMAYPKVRNMIASGFVSCIENLPETPNVIIGTATAGIPHAAWVAERLNLPMAYVRSKPKAHGRGNQIEGKVEPHQKAVIIEDLISTGGSSLQAAQAVRETGATVLAVLAIFSYGFPTATNAFQQANIPFETLTNFETLLEVALLLNKIKPQDIEQLKTWQQQL